MDIPIRVYVIPSTPVLGCTPKHGSDTPDVGLPGPQVNPHQILVCTTTTAGAGQIVAPIPRSIPARESSTNVQESHADRRDEMERAERCPVERSFWVHHVRTGRGDDGGGEMPVPPPLPTPTLAYAGKQRGARGRRERR
jgi:hypothetical protein